MAQLKFFGGVHPEDGKEISSRQPVRTVFPRGDCVYPLKQHMGNPSVPIVKRGDYVLTGQLIAAADGDFSANLHSSVSGTVRGIEKRRLADGSSGDCIVIQNDRRFGEILYPASRRLDELAPETIVESVKQAGIVGMGGAGMPTHIKLSPARPNRIDYYIANCVECEPYLTSDYRRMLENPAKVINGLRIGLKIFRRARGILAVDEKNDDIYRLFRDLTREDARIFVKKVEHKFPQGAERQRRHTGCDQSGSHGP
jgi:electron transport complex protein RnfC